MLLAVREKRAPQVDSAVVTQGAVDQAYEAQGLVLAGLLDRAAQLWPNGEKIRRFVDQAATTRGYYERLAGTYAGDADRMLEAATQLRSLGYPTEARRIYEQILHLEPGDFRVRLNLALAVADAGDSGRAVDMLARLRADNPRSAIVLHDLGSVLLASGDPSGAAGQLEQAVRWDPDSIGSRLALAEARVRLGEADKAEAVLRVVIDREPLVADAHDLMGQAATLRGDVDLALSSHRRAVELFPYSAAFQHHLGNALATKREWEDAVRAQRAALRIDPRHAMAADALGVAFAGMGHFDQAADWHVLALELDPESVNAALHLAAALRLQGKDRDAVQALCVALRISPGLPFATRKLAELRASEADCEK
jgi:tetratricopeptide (TPR) repeat protein